MSLSSLNSLNLVVGTNQADGRIATPESTDPLSRAQRGDSDAFCEVCLAYESRLRRQATALCGDAALAEDLAQETLVEAWKSIRRFNGKCKFFTWLCSIMMNLHRNVRRNSRKHPIALSDLRGSDCESVQERVDNCTLIPDQMTLTAERASQLCQLLDCLSKKHREVIYLRFYVDDSLEGIAAALGCSVGTVKSRLYHALEKLRRMMPHSQREEEV